MARADSISRSIWIERADLRAFVRHRIPGSHGLGRRRIHCPGSLHARSRGRSLLVPAVVRRHAVSEHLSAAAACAGGFAIGQRPHFAGVSLSHGHGPLLLPGTGRSLLVSGEAHRPCGGRFFGSDAVLPVLPIRGVVAGIARGYRRRSARPPAAMRRSLWRGTTCSRPGTDPAGHPDSGTRLHPQQAVPLPIGCSGVDGGCVD